MELSIYNTPISRRCVYISAPTSGGLLKPIWDAAFKPWRLKKELISSCNLIPLCHHVWDLIADYKATFTTISHLQLGLCILLNKQFELIYQNCINLSRLLTGGQEIRVQNTRELPDSDKPQKKKKIKKKVLKALTDQSAISDELLALEDKRIDVDETLELVPYSMEMMSLADQSQVSEYKNPSNYLDNYWNLLNNELLSKDEETTTRSIDYLSNTINIWSPQTKKEELVNNTNYLDKLFNDPLSGEKLTPAPFFQSPKYDIDTDWYSSEVKSTHSSQTREKNILKYDTHVFTPRKPKKKRLSAQKGQQKLDEIQEIDRLEEKDTKRKEKESEEEYFSVTRIVDSPVPTEYVDSKTPAPLLNHLTNILAIENKNDLIESALTKLVNEAVAKQDELNEFHIEHNDSAYISKEYPKASDEKFNYDLNLTSTKKLYNSYKNCIRHGEKLDFTEISRKYSREDAALMFYRTLLLVNGGFIDIHQEFSDTFSSSIYITID